MSILVKDKILPEDINSAEEMLLKFCEVYPSIYGMTAQTMNLHLLRHIAACTRHYGPLFCFSCFGLESMNSFLKKMVHGTRHINSQVSFAVVMAKKLVPLIKQMTGDDVDEKIRKLITQLGSKYRIEEDRHSYICEPLGKSKSIQRTDEIYNLLTQEMKRSTPKLYMRIKLGSTVYYGKDYQATKTRNSHTVLYYDGFGESCGMVTSFVMVEKSVYAVLKKMETQPFAIDIATKRALQNTNLHAFSLQNLCCHMRQVVFEQEEKQLVPVKYLWKICLLLDTNPNLKLISIPPNVVEHS